MTRASRLRRQKRGREGRTIGEKRGGRERRDRGEGVIGDETRQTILRLELKKPILASSNETWRQDMDFLWSREMKSRNMV